MRSHTAIARRSVLPLLALLVVALTLGGMWLWPRGRPNVILITIDTLRPDRLSAYGYDRHQTPHFDRLANEGMLFEHAFCDVTWTTPSMASVMTGKYATRHGLRSSFHFLPTRAITLAEILGRLGYRTAAIIASYPLHSIYGLNQGFQLYDETFHHAIVTDGTFDRAKNEEQPDHVDRRDPIELGAFLRHVAATEAYRDDRETTERTLRWLREERHEPFFLWVHYFGPHEKQMGGAYLEERQKQIAAYDPDVLVTDRELGRVLTALDDLGLTENTAVILNADHGQSIMEHGYFGHGVNIYDPTQHIPLMMRYPGRVPAGVRVDRMVRNLDIFSTVLEIVGAPPVVATDGTSLLFAAPPDAGAKHEIDDATYVETYLSATWLFARVIDFERDIRVPYRRLGWRTLRWKYILNDPVAAIDPPYTRPIDEALRKKAWSEELYDLAADPGETVNVIVRHPDVAARLRAKVFAVQGESTAAKGTAPIRPLDPAARERLRSLGYLGD